MRIKMAPSDSGTKVALGVLAFVGVGITLYILSKQLRKKKKAKDDTGTPAATVTQDASAPVTEKREKDSSTDVKSSPAAVSSDDTEPKVPLESAAGLESLGTATEDAPISASVSSWEEVKQVSESFTEVRSVSESFAELPSAGGDMLTSRTSEGSMGSFTELGLGRESTNHADEEESVNEKSGGGDAQSVTESKEEEENGVNVKETEGDTTTPSSIQREGVVTDDVQSLQSEDASSGGEAPSFEQINSSDEAASAAGSNGVEGADGHPDISFQPLKQQLTDSLQSFEQIGVEVSGVKTDGNSASFPSFEQIVEPGEASSLNPVESSIVVIPESLEQESLSTETKAGDEKSQIEEKPQTQSAGSEDAEEEMQRPRSSSLSDGASDKSGTLKGGLGGSSEEYYSSESLQSFATATSGTSKQDFYSPISSPPTVNSSMDNISFQSFDDSVGETSEELTFYDLEASGRETSQSPQDRTPTNTPVPEELAGAESAETPEEEMMSSQMEKSLIADETQQQAEEGEAGKSPPGSLAESQQQKSEAKVPETSSEGRMLNIDKDKMTEAILQAQSSPDRLEIGNLQILVELLKQDDWTLMNTAVECIIRATAFTINVKILTVCEGPKELARLLERFALLLVSESDPASQGQREDSPKVKTLFLNVARAVNNLAMDIKSQPQLEGTIPVLTDLLMTEGISESVTLASLQPLTNLSSSNTYHGHYTRLLQQLYSFLDTSQSAPLRLQCLKLLVNLSLNADMVPHMLAAKAPACLLDLLDINYDVDLLLRTVTFLANIMTIMQERDLSPSSLPPDEKAPSPETLHSALFALDRRNALRNKVYRLTRHTSEDVCYQASRLYKFVVSSK